MAEYAGNGDSPRSGGGRPLRGTNGGSLTKALFSSKKSVSYNATNSDLLYSVGDSTSATATSGRMPNEINIYNRGSVPAIIMVSYATYSDETTITDGAENRYIHYMLMPGHSFSPPTRAVIMTANDAAVKQFDGSILTNEAPNSNMYTDISTVANAAFDVTTDPVSFDVADGDLFHVGDMVRCQAEVVEITAISGDTIIVKRGMLGTSAAAHADGETLRLQHSNDYHDIGKFSVSQTDPQGRYKCSNMFGYARAATDLQGIVPGSFALKFYEQGYHALGLSGITASTNSGLTASTAYEFDIQVDGGTNFDNLSFTTDTTDVSFGKIIRLIQSALDTQFYTAGNLFEKKVNVALVEGDVRFTSGSYLSTSAIALTAGSSGTAEFFGSGRIPASGSIENPVPANLPYDVIYDKVTYATSPTNVFCYDNGQGRLMGMCNGDINYHTGAINIVGAPPNAEFVYSVAYNSAFSGGKKTGSATKGGVLKQILVNTISQKIAAEVEIEAF